MFRTFLASLLALGFVVFASASAEANPRYAAIVVDAKTGKTLFSRHADAARFPASITKVMTLYMMFEAIEQGRVKPSDRITMSRHAAGMPPSKLGIGAGNTIRVDEAIKALVTKSANDVAAAMGEHLGGTESQFAAMMTEKARQLGMKNTTFRNASGLPNSGQKTTARDLARLGIAVREHFPRQFGVFKTRSFRHRGTTYSNHNRLLGSVSCVDGIKTGYIRASGFNLLASCKTGNRNIVAVVMGGRSGKTRNAHMAELINGYVGRASRGRDRTIVGRPSATRFAALTPALPPMPRVRPAWAAPAVALASAAPARLAQPAGNKGSIGTFIASAVPTPRPTPRQAPAAAPVQLASLAPAAPVGSRGSIATQAAATQAAQKGDLPSDLPKGSIYGESARLAAMSMPQTLNVNAARKAALPGATLAGSTLPRAPLDTAATEVATARAAYAQPVSQTPAVFKAQAVPEITGWVVQIAAVDDASRAMEMLAAAKAKVPAVAHTQPFTQPVVKGGATLHRARLAGFNGKDHAWAACESLTLAGVACYATQNR